jgi:hypothetical protein
MCRMAAPRIVKIEDGRGGRRTLFAAAHAEGVTQSAGVSDLMYLANAAICWSLRTLPNGGM